MKILIVDDSPEVLEALEAVLQQEGFVVETAANGFEALQKLSAGQPCVVILDLLMPVMGGAELYERMQEDERLKRVPVIISTSAPSKAPAGSLIVKKPVNVDRLLRMVRVFCGSPA